MVRESRGSEKETISVRVKEKSIGVEAIETSRSGRVIMSGV
jgi:hypothetical protein